MDVPDFTSAEAKLGRAEEHLEALHRKINAWMDSKPYAIEVGSVFYPFDRSRPRKLRLDVWEVDDPPPEISLALGDSLTNLFASLDHVAWQIVSTSPKWPPAGNEPYIYFPICEVFDRKGKGSAGFRQHTFTQHAPIRARRAVQKHQPYHRGNKASLHNLFVLKRLVDRDKHKALHPVLISLHDIEPEITPWGGTIERVKYRAGTRLEKGAEVATVFIRAEGMASVDVDRVAVEIAFDELTPVRLPAMANIADEVRSVIADCKAAYL